MKTTLLLPALVVSLAVSGHSVPAHGQTPSADRVKRVDRLLQELLAYDGTGPSLERYIRIKDTNTQQVLSEVDAFIRDTFIVNSSFSSNEVDSGLRKLLHVQTGPLARSTFYANLPSGRFLVVCVEVRRTGGSGPEDAMWFRAYREVGSQYLLAAAAEFPLSENTSQGEQRLMGNMRTVELRSRPVASEFWFVAWAQMDSPPPAVMIALRLLAFDGKAFRTVATADRVSVSDFDRAVEDTKDGYGFTLRRSPDGSATTVIERYTATATGLVKLP